METGSLTSIAWSTPSSKTASHPASLSQTVSRRQQQPSTFPVLSPPALPRGWYLAELVGDVYGKDFHLPGRPPDASRLLACVARGGRTACITTLKVSAVSGPVKRRLVQCHSRARRLPVAEPQRPKTSLFHSGRTTTSFTGFYPFATFTSVLHLKYRHQSN